MKDFFGIFKKPAWNESAEYWVKRTWTEWFEAMPAHTSKGLTEHLQQDFPPHKMRGWEEAKRFWSMPIGISWEELPITLRGALQNWFSVFGAADGDPGAGIWDGEKWIPRPDTS